MYVLKYIIAIIINVLLKKVEFDQSCPFVSFISCRKKRIIILWKTMTSHHQYHHTILSWSRRRTGMSLSQPLPRDLQRATELVECPLDRYPA